MPLDASCTHRCTCAQFVQMKPLRASTMPDPVQQSDRGYNIGIRLIDEFLAKSKTSRCGDFRETAEKVAKVTLFDPVKCTLSCLRGCWSQQQQGLKPSSCVVCSWASRCS